MDTSLCVILPVRNAQHQIACRLSELLEFLPDLTSQFQIIVVDDASTDHTEEVVQALSQTFPQIRFIRHRMQVGSGVAVQTGLQSTDADIVFVHQANARVSQARMWRLWEMRNDDQLVMARSMPEPKPIPRRVIDGLVNWGTRLTNMDETSAETGSIEMLRRSGEQSSDGRISRRDQAQSGVSQPQTDIVAKRELARSRDPKSR